LKQNRLCNREAGKVLSEMLVVNTVLKELDLSENRYYQCDVVGFAQELDVGIKDSGAMTTLILKDNRLLHKESGTALRNMLKFNTVLTKLDVSDNGYASDDDGPGFAQELAIGIKDNSAISSVNVLGNYIGVEQAQELINILQAKDKLTTLCGFSGDETELDLRNKNLSAGCAVLVANEISDMGALSKLNLSMNDIPAAEAAGMLSVTCKAKGVDLAL
jgi:hypothetical protein